MLFKIFFLCLCLNVCLKGIAEASVSVTEVPAGQLAELPCLSSDDQHRFMFWQVTDDVIIGPGNTIDENKYNYEVLTGKLLIKVITTFYIFKTVEGDIKSLMEYVLIDFIGSINS